MDGISAKVAKGLRAFNCPGCGAAVSIRALGFSVSAVCPSCKSIIDINNENFKIIARAAAAKAQYKYYIEPGTRGMIKGMQLECIGIVVRCDGTQQYFWTEYLLFNPFLGFRWLVENEGHWNFVTMVKDRPGFSGATVAPDNLFALKTQQPRSLSYQNRNYQIFVSGEAIVKHVIGEFYWRVKVGEKIKASDYIAPPYMLSYERSGSDLVWSHAEYLDPSVIRDTFRPKSGLPTRSGIGPNQPVSASASFGEVRNYFVFFAMALFLLQVVHLMRFHSETIFQEQFNYASSDPNKTRLSQKFTVPESAKNLEIDINAPVDNSWLEVKGDLVSDKDGKSENDFDVGVEYYSGYDDGYWSEGSRSSAAPLGDVEPGTYSLKLEANGPLTAAPYVNPITSMDYRVALNINNPNFSNFFVGLLLLALWPIYLFARKTSVEISRWSNSDFPKGGD